jgi:hypothetical protein
MIRRLAWCGGTPHPNLPPQGGKGFIAHVSPLMGRAFFSVQQNATARRNCIPPALFPV